MNIIGVEGCVNKTGVPGGNSDMYISDNSERFYSQIEDGVKSVIQTCIDLGFNTYSSCQGHSFGSKYCFISLIDECDTIILLKKNLLDFLKLNECSIIVQCEKYINDMDIYEQKFKDAYILKIIFGKYNYKYLEKNKSIFCKWITNYCKVSQ